MISKNSLKYIKSLQIKKIRKQENKFLVEGGKSVLELHKSDFNTIQIFSTNDFFNQHRATLSKICDQVVICSEKELSEMGNFSSNNTAIAMVDCKENLEIRPDTTKSECVLLLDDINDPGNLGTIIRIADWYGISKIIASENTVDLYNSKVISASMGSFTRVNIFYTALEAYMSKYKTHVIAARLEGKSIYETNFKEPNIMLLMGSEAHGIQERIYPWVDEFVFIPRQGSAESLNVGVATAIFCDHIKRPKT